MANTRNAYGSLLNTVVGLATATGEGIDLVSKGMQSATMSMDAHLRDKQVRLKAESFGKQKEIFENTALSIEEHRAQIQGWLDANPSRAESFNETLAELEKFAVGDHSANKASAQA